MNQCITNPDEDRFEARIDVSFSFPVVFCQDVFDLECTALADIINQNMEPAAKPRLVVWFDQGFLDAWPGTEEKASKYFEKHLPQITFCGSGSFEGGEPVKNGWEHVLAMLKDLSGHNLCRKSFVLAMGGGAFLDAAGFAASLFHRGTNLIRLPTTVLSQNDSGVGVKNGINAEGKKNFLGAFAPPLAVVSDLTVLSTLEPDVMRDGLAESFKVAIIKDEPFFRFLCENATALGQGEKSVLEESVKKTALLHLSHIAAGGDPFEKGASRPLDFGHWAAHRLESMSDYVLRHGQAVAIGLALDSCYAHCQGLLNDRELDLILSGLEESGLPTWHPLLEKIDPQGRLMVLAGIEEFREHLGGALAVTLPKGLGQRVEMDTMDEAMIAGCIRELSGRFGQKQAPKATA